MSGERTVKIKFVGDASGLQDASQKSETALGKWKASTVALGAAAGVALQQAGQALFQFSKDSIMAFAESEEAQGRLEDAFARFPALADTNIGKLEGIAEALALKTKFDDDATKSGQAMLAQFGLTGAQLEEITPLLQDFAAKTGKDLPTAAESLGKSFLGTTRALKEVGIEYESTGDKAQDIANITALLREQVGGFAEQQGQTAAGQAAILTNQFGELKEQLGAQLLPVMMKAAEVGLKVVDWISKNKDVVLPLIGVIGAVTAVQIAWNIAMAANPIGLVVIAIAALVAAIVWVATKTTFFQDTWNAAWGWAKRTAIDVWEWMQSLPGKIGNVFSAIGGFITAPFRAAFNFISDAWNNTIGGLHWKAPAFLGGWEVSVPQLRKFHGGGVVPGPFGREVPILARAGERVLTAEQDAALSGPLYAEIDLGEGISQVVEIKLRRRDRDTRRRVLAGAGAR